MCQKTQLLSCVVLREASKVNLKVKKAPHLYFQSVGYEKSKDGKNVPENKATDGGRGLGSDIALWLLISARRAQPIMISKHSLLLFSS